MPYDPTLIPLFNMQYAHATTHFLISSTPYPLYAPPLPPPHIHTNRLLV